MNKADWSTVPKEALVYILPDNDPPGEKYSKDVTGILSGLNAAQKIKLIHLNDLPPSGDVVNWLQHFLPSWDGYSDIPIEQVEFLKGKLLEKCDLLAANPPAEWLKATRDEWEEFIPIDKPLLLPWPEYFLPFSVRTFVEELAASTETPIELPALMAFSVLSTACAGKYVVEVKPGYIEPLNIWPCAL